MSESGSAVELGWAVGQGNRQVPFVCAPSHVHQRATFCVCDRTRGNRDKDDWKTSVFNFCEKVCSNAICLSPPNTRWPFDTH